MNYAKLSYEIGNPFEKSSKGYSNFLKLYPKNENQGLLRELLISSTLEQKFYSAIEILENDNALRIIKLSKKF